MSSRSNRDRRSSTSSNELPPPKIKKIKDPIKSDVPPGGSQTPGAKGTYPKKK